MLAYYVGSSLMGSAGGWFYAVEGWAAVVIFTLAMLALAFVSACFAQHLARRKA
jgi:YNFM family putative membrane transporter